MIHRGICTFAILFLLIPLRSAAAAEPLAKVELEIATAASTDVSAQRRWYERLKGLHLGGLRLRQAREGESPDMTERRGLPGHYKVLAILAPGDRLLLPGASFTGRDISALKRHLTRLVEEGPDGVTAPRGAFGLTEKQFTSIHSDLARSIGFETKGRPLREVVDLIGKMFTHDVDVDARAEHILGRAKATDEMNGFTAGTGLAILLRAKDLALRPIIDRGKLSHRIFLIPDGEGKKEEGDSYWSAGHKPEANLRSVLPMMLEQLNVQIEGYTLTEALEALQTRIKAPFLFDHGALAAQEIEPGKVQVRFPAGRAFYKRVLDNILYQAKLKGEVRIDEGGKAFYWITARRAPRRAPH